MGSYTTRASSSVPLYYATKARFPVSLNVCFPLSSRLFRVPVELSIHHSTLEGVYAACSPPALPRYQDLCRVHFKGKRIRFPSFSHVRQFFVVLPPTPSRLRLLMRHIAVRRGYRAEELTFFKQSIIDPVSTINHLWRAGGHQHKYSTCSSILKNNSLIHIKMLEGKGRITVRSF